MEPERQRPHSPGESIGNKNSSVFTTQAVITSLTDGKLELEAGGQKDAYTRVKP